MLSLDKPTPVKTTWTLLLYLTSAAEGCVGGETVFYPHDRRSAKEEIAVPLETGMVLLHKHGDDCLLVRLPSKMLSLPPCNLHGALHILTCLTSSSTKDEKSRLAKNGS